VSDYIVQGWGQVGVRLARGGVEVEITGSGYSQLVLVSAADAGRVARDLRDGKEFSVRGFGGSQEAILWARRASRSGWLSLSASTAMAYWDMQYPSVEIGPKVAARLAELIEPNPLAGARRRRDDNLREVFGG